MKTARQKVMRKRMTTHLLERSLRLALSKGSPKRKAKTGLCVCCILAWSHFFTARDFRKSKGTKTGKPARRKAVKGFEEM
jgi:hypothetical protein